MEILLELFYTIVFSIFLSFFVSKLLSWDSSGDRRAQPDSNSPLSEPVIDLIISEKSTGFDLKIVLPFPFSQVVIQEIVDDVVINNEAVSVDGEARSQDTSVDSAEVRADGDIVVGVNDESVGDFVNVVEDNLVDEIPDNENELAKGEIGVMKNVVDDKETLLTDDDDDWEGIERTELEKQFDEAVAFVQCMSDLDSNTAMQFYGLHKVATEGPCNELQPMAFKVFARAKWQAWHVLGNLSSEEAMEQYINLLSQTNPDWLRGGDICRQELLIL